MILVSDNARDKLNQLLIEDNGGKEYVRVGVESGGCSGLVYKLDFDDSMNNQDELVQHIDIKLVINKKSILFLAGTTLEYSSGLNGKGFVFNNPNANRTCGCGESFSL